MKLSERLAQLGIEDHQETEVQPSGAQPTVDGDRDREREHEPERKYEIPVSERDPLADFKAAAKRNLFGKLEERGIVDASLDEADLKAAVVAELEKVIADSASPLSLAERERIAEEISQDILGYGPIQRFLDDPEVTEIMVTSTRPIYIERAGRLHETTVRFSSEDDLRLVIDRIVSKIGRRVDEASPMVDARLPDGSRVNAVVPPLAVDGPALTVRKFSADPYRVEHLVEFGTMTKAIASFLEVCVRGKLNILVSGGTGTGKTTMLNVLSSFIPGDERIVTIEDAVELQLLQRHVVRMEARPPNVEGRGEVTIRDLVRNSLRMRPDRIIVGEVRGPEALDMMQAMNTGHEGSLSTLHANTPRDALSRLETMILMAGFDLPVIAIREYMSSALSLIVHLARMSDGSRKIVQVAEVVGMEGETITMQDIFKFRQQGVDEDGKVVGRMVATGIRPLFAEELAERGMPLPMELFGESEAAA